MAIFLKGLILRGLGLKILFVGSTLLLVSPLLPGLFQPSQDENLSTGVALEGPLFRYRIGWAAGPPEVIDSPNFT